MPALTPEGLTAEDGRSYAQRQSQRQRQSRAGDDEGALARVSATSPTSAKLADLTVRLDAALAAAGANPIGPDDLAILNAAVVELQAYEALRAAPPEAPPTEAPVNRDVPYASQAGDTLSCTMGNWENVPDSYLYQWQLDGVDVGSANAEPTYVVLPSDAGMTATCVVTATNAIGSTVAPPSNPVVVEAPAAREA